MLARQIGGPKDQLAAKQLFRLLFAEVAMSVGVFTRGNNGTHMPAVELTCSMQMQKTLWAVHLPIPPSRSQNNRP